MNQGCIFSESEVDVYYRSRLPGLKRREEDFRGPCPIHNGRNSNFSVEPSTGRYFCHSKCKAGGSIVTLEQHLGGGTTGEAYKRICEIVGHPFTQSAAGRVVAVYPYYDETGNILHETVRYEPKNLKQRRPNGSDDYIWDLKGGRFF